MNNIVSQISSAIKYKTRRRLPCSILASPIFQLQNFILNIN